MIGGYKWHYGTVVPKSQSCRKRTEFFTLVPLRAGGCQGRPLNGRFSETGLPSKPELIHPADGEVFAHYPRLRRPPLVPLLGRVSAALRNQVRRRRRRRPFWRRSQCVRRGGKDDHRTLCRGNGLWHGYRDLASEGGQRQRQERVVGTEILQV